MQHLHLAQATGDEIDLEENDKVEVMEEVGAGWTHGRNLRTGAVGAFPTAYISPQSSPSPDEPCREDTVNIHIRKESVLPDGSETSNFQTCYAAYEYSANDEGTRLV